ncbi:MAG: hypothetical protein M3271_09075, partial [Actinomycetota bacterium]|nr:hypothetical protein [Actinomycetota bacterium]
ETSFDGRDGAWRTRCEAGALHDLVLAGIPVPQVYECFSVSGNSYLAIEDIEGEVLQDLLVDHRLKPNEAVRRATQMAGVVADIHAAGWVWRDCKPANFIADTSLSLRPIDFEGSCRLGEQQDTEWASPGYLPPEGLAGPASESGDLYALGASMHQLLTGSIINEMPLTSLAEMRPEVPAEVSFVVNSLLSKDPSRRRPATWAQQELLQFQHHASEARSTEAFPLSA